MGKSKFVGLMLIVALFSGFPVFADGDLQTPPGVVDGQPGVVDSYTPPQPQPEYSNPQQQLPPEFSNPEPTSVAPTLPSTNSAIDIDTSSGDRMMEQCHVLDNDGNGLIKAYMADSGPNLEGDASAWIWVPRGQCARLNAGDYSGISPEILNKINPSDITQAQTIE